MPSSSEVEHLTVNQNVAGSTPAQAAKMLTVAQMVEHLIVIQKGVSSILICQPNGEAEQVASPTDCKSAV